MNIIAQQDALKNLPEDALRKELLQPSGAAPSYLVLSELQRRKDMQSRFAASQNKPGGSMAEEFAMGVGGAQAGNYPEAVRQAMPGPEQMAQPPQGMNAPQGFADGGGIDMAQRAQASQPAQSGALNQENEEASSWFDYVMGRRRDALGLGPLAGPAMAPITAIAEGRPFGEVLGSFSPGYGIMRGLGVKLADGGEVEDPPWYMPSVKRGIRALKNPRSNPLTDLLTIPGTVEIPLPNADPEAMKRYFKDRPAAAAAAEAEFWRRDPGSSWGQTKSDQLKGVTPQGMRRDTGETGGPPEMMVAGGGQGFSGTDPSVDMPMPEGNRQLSYGDPYNQQASPNARLNPAVPPGGGVPPGSVPPGGGGAAPRGGVAGAMNIGGEGLADYYNQYKSLRAPDPYGGLEAENAQDRADLKSQRNSEGGMALLNAGAAMAAGESPHALTNIGRGVLAGSKYWQEAEKEMARANRDIRNAQTALVIAKDKRDADGVEGAAKLYAAGEARKMHAEEMRERAAERAARRGGAGEDRATRAAERKEDRAEAIIQRDTALAISDVNSIAGEIKVMSHALESMALDPGIRSRYEKDITGKQTELGEARARLKRLQSLRDDKSGASLNVPAGPPGPVIGNYVPGKGIVKP